MDYDYKNLSGETVTINNNNYSDRIKLYQAYPSSTVYGSDHTYGQGVSVTVGYLCDFCSNPYDFCIQNGDEYQVAVFVDEYVYGSSNPKNGDPLEIKKWVNAVNRQFILDPFDIKVSDDNQSIVYDDYIFSIAQRSIQTPYDLDELDKGTFNSAFGLETWDETSNMNVSSEDPNYTTTYGGVKKYDVLTVSGGVKVPYYEYGDEDDEDPKYIEIPSYTSTSKADNYDAMYGRANTIALHKESGNVIPSDYWKEAGYNGARDDNNVSQHTWKMTTVHNAIQAVMMRNRDLNGNGVIDDNEIKWYLPAIAQFYTVWLGQTALDGDTRLMNLNWFNNSYYLDDEKLSMNKGYPKFFTSSGGGNMVYWQDQGTSVSTREDLGKSWFQPYHYARAARNIPDYNTIPEFPVDASTYQSSNIIVVNGLNDDYLRSAATGDNYFDFHFEREDGNGVYPNKNELYPAIEVSENEYTIATPSGASSTMTTANFVNAISYDGTNASYINTAWENIYTNYIKPKLTGNDVGKEWRIPNQRELMLLYRYNDKTGKSYLSDTSPSTFYICCTYFTKAIDAKTISNRRCIPFTANGGKMNLVVLGNLMNDKGTAYTATIKVRLVRDRQDYKPQ